MENVKIAIIGGTGVYHFQGIADLQSSEIQTDYGTASVAIGTLNAKRVAFLARHGQDHSIAPSRINYRANIAALKKLGVQYILATACSGSLNPAYRVGDLVLLDQFLEFTKNRPDTFLDGTDGGRVGHVDNTVPYCKMLRTYVQKAGNLLGETVQDGAVYCCVEGPRFESSAEIEMLRILKADLVGQTNYPEVALAREAELCYCAVGIVSNQAAGIAPSAITATEVAEIMRAKMSRLQELLTKTIALLDEEQDCSCHHVLEQAFL